MIKLVGHRISIKAYSNTLKLLSLLVYPRKLIEQLPTSALAL
jgi:hypothetical protein